MTLDWTGSPQQEDWHTWRGKGLGSSDAPVIMGLSPWKNQYQLWMEKTGQTEGFQGNWATERGQRLEPLARDMYNKKYGTNMVVAQMENGPVFRASFDGVDHAIRKIIEIKCPGKVAHQAALCGEVPDYYAPQVQWLLMISGYDECDYVSWDGESDDLVVITVKANREYHESMIASANEFWNLVQTKTPPPTEWLTVEDTELLAALEHYENERVQLAAIEKTMDELKKTITKLAKSPMLTCGNFKVQWVERIGNVDYSKIPELNGLDLNQYRKPASKYLTIKKVK